MCRHKREGGFALGIGQLLNHPIILFAARLPVWRGPVEQRTVVVVSVVGCVVQVQDDEVAGPVPECVIAFLPIRRHAAIGRIVAHRAKTRATGVDITGAIPGTGPVDFMIADHILNGEVVAHAYAGLAVPLADHLCEECLPMFVRGADDG